MKQQPVDDGVIPGRSPRMNNHSCRLFDDGQVVVFVVDLQGHGFGLKPIHSRSSRKTEIQLDGFDTPQAVSVLFLKSADADCSGLIQCLNMRSRHTLKMAREEHIQALTAILRPDLELHCETS